MKLMHEISWFTNEHEQKFMNSHLIHKLHYVPGGKLGKLYSTDVKLV